MKAGMQVRTVFCAIKFNFLTNEGTIPFAVTGIFRCPDNPAASPVNTAGYTYIINAFLYNSPFPILLKSTKKHP